MKIQHRIVMILTMTVMVVTLLSCADSYPDLTYIGKDINKEEYNKYPLSPSLHFNSMLYATSNGVQSKASASVNAVDEGPLDPENNYDNFIKRYAKAKFYLLAYRKSVFKDNAELSGQPRFDELMSDDDDRKNCLLSTERTYISGSGQHIGKLAVPKGASPDGSMTFLSTNGSLDLKKNVSWEDNLSYEDATYYWNYKKYEKVGYNFFAYYVNNANIYGFEKQDERVVIDLELDGKNDIMVGCAPEVTDSLLRADFSTSVTTDSIRTNIINYGDKAYSTYGAVHSVEPKIDLKHALAYIKFRVKLMDEATKVAISDLRVRANTRGKLIVASRDVKELGLTELSDEKEVKVEVEYLDNLSTDEFTDIGEGVLVPPAPTYTVVVDIEERNKRISETGNVTGNIVTSLPITCTPENGFEAGKIYVLDLSVYGRTEIVISTDVEAWKSGEGTSVNLYDE